MQNSSSARRCVFCDTPLSKSSTSREDTIPKWVQAQLGIADDVVGPTLTSPTGEQLAQRVHPVDQLLTGAVCRRCNNGWMSDLEGDARPVLQALITARRSLAELTRPERHLLARWTVKTAFMLDVGGLERRVPAEHLRALHDNPQRLPEHVHVFGRLHPRTRGWYYCESAWWNHAELTAAAQLTVQTFSYKIAIQLGDLIVVVASWPLRKWGLRTPRRELFLVWPPTAIVKQYTHPEPQDIAESDAACRWHNITISVVPLRGAEGRME